MVEEGFPPGAHTQSVGVSKVQLNKVVIITFESNKMDSRQRH